MPMTTMTTLSGPNSLARRARDLGPDIAAVVILILTSVALCARTLPAAFVDPRSTDWIFNQELAVRDNAGGAIGTMLFLAEPWQWPPGTISTVAAPLGSNLVSWAATPLLSVLAKTFTQMAGVEPLLQFAGVQVAIGWSLTAVFAFILARNLGSPSKYAFLAGLFALGSEVLIGRFNNHALTWQFLVIIPIILLIRRTTSIVRWMVSWPLVLVCTVGVNFYFTVLALAFLIADAAIAWWQSGKSLRGLGRQISLMLPGAAAFACAAYVFGAFAVGTSGIGTGAAQVNEFSAGVLALVDGDYLVVPPAGDPAILSREGSVFIGLLPICLMVILLLHRWRSRQSLIGTRIGVRGAVIVAFACLVISWGAQWRFLGSFSIDVPVPEPVLALLSGVRAVGRLAWPMHYMLLAASCLAIPILVSWVTRSLRITSIQVRLMSAWVVVALFAALATVHAFRAGEPIAATLAEATGTPRSPWSNWDPELAGVKSIEVVPAYDGDTDGLPWRPLSRVIVTHGMTMDTWGFLARYSAESAGKIQSERFEKFISCQLDKDVLYVVRRSILSDQQALCSKNFLVVYSADTWVGVRFY